MNHGELKNNNMRKSLQHLY